MNLKDSYLHGTDQIALIRALKWDGGVLKYQSASTSTDWISVGAIPIWNQNTTGKAATAGTADKVKNSLTFTGGVTGLRETSFCDIKFEDTFIIITYSPLPVQELSFFP